MENTNMHSAKTAKNDEFYTRLQDIERELEHYKSQFKDKVIYCNCDNPNLYKNKDFGSKFWLYFYENFHHLGLKQLYATSYNADGTASNKYEYDGYNIQISKLEGDGDFRSEESIEILKKSDIVVTNPPFSLYREYVDQLIEYNKKFIIIGNFNSVTYKNIFPLIKNGKMGLGYTRGIMTFIIDGGGEKDINATWFTNLDVDYKNRSLFLHKSYYKNPENYPKYDNYDAIEVSKVNMIPDDYYGIMGVPITFLNKYNPEQFEILGSQRWAKDKELLDIYTGDVVPPENDKKTLIQGKETYDRIFIKRKDIK